MSIIVTSGDFQELLHSKVCITVCISFKNYPTHGYTSKKIRNQYIEEMLTSQAQYNMRYKAEIYSQLIVKQQMNGKGKRLQGHCDKLSSH